MGNLSQEQMVLQYMQKYGSITSLDAIRDLGITRLSDRIYNLKRKYDIPISKTTEKSINRWGKQVIFAKYFIAKEGEKNE